MRTQYAITIFRMMPQALIRPCDLTACRPCCSCLKISVHSYQTIKTQHHPYIWCFARLCTLCLLHVLLVSDAAMCMLFRICRHKLLVVMTSLLS